MKHIEHFLEDEREAELDTFEGKTRGRSGEVSNGNRIRF